jgi:hypothetical protein
LNEYPGPPCGGAPEKMADMLKAREALGCWYSGRGVVFAVSGHNGRVRWRECLLVRLVELTLTRSCEAYMCQDPARAPS